MKVSEGNTHRDSSIVLCLKPVSFVWVEIPLFGLDPVQRRQRNPAPAASSIVQMGSVHLQTATMLYYYGVVTQRLKMPLILTIYSVL